MMQAGRELNETVGANVLGLECVTFPNGACPHIKHWRDGGKAICLPNYSTNIADAWIVVEKLAGDGHALALQAPGSTDMNEAYREFTRWTADFGTNNISGYTEANGDTAPHAICMAALKIVGYSFP